MGNVCFLRAPMLVLFLAVIGLHTVPAEKGSEATRLRGDSQKTEGSLSRLLASDAGNKAWSDWWPFSSSSSTSSSNEQSSSSLSRPGSGAGLLNYTDYVHTHGVAPENGEAPACAMQRSMDSDGLLCTAAAGWITIVETIPPQLGFGSTSKKPVDPDGDLPKALDDLRPMQDVVASEQIQAELPTYYWYVYIDTIFGLEGNGVLRQQDTLIWDCPLGLIGIDSPWGIPPPLHRHNINDDDRMNVAAPAEWSNIRSYSVVTAADQDEDTQGSSGWEAPLVLSLMKGNHMVVLIRGTEYASEWRKDFEYWYAPKNKSQAFFPGRVHAGFYSVFQAVRGPLIEREVKKQNPARVSVAGHSLGGGVGALIAYRIADILPNVTVDLITYGAPNVGDGNFTDAFDSKVNNRHLTFTGVGDVDDSYYIGDFISQVPCKNIHGCPLLMSRNASDAERDQEADMTFQYHALGGVVPFTANDLQNSRQWRSRSDLLSWRYSPVADHVCSYLCYTAPSVGDPENRCVFTLEWTDTPLEYRCPIMM